MQSVLKVTPNILTASGKYFDFLEPRAEHVDIEDIATALSRICRFTGHTRSFYSVAQHSVYVSYLVPEEFALQGLLHDASEAYMGDVSTPLKQLIPEYKAIEHRVEQAIAEKFGLPFPLHPSVKQADLTMLVTEKRDLMPTPTWEQREVDRCAWEPFEGISPRSVEVVPFSPDEARALFMRRYTRLTDKETA